MPIKNASINLGPSHRMKNPDSSQSATEKAAEKLPKSMLKNSQKAAQKAIDRHVGAPQLNIPKKTVAAAQKATTPKPRINMSRRSSNNKKGTTPTGIVLGEGKTLTSPFVTQKGISAIPKGGLFSKHQNEDVAYTPPHQKDKSDGVHTNEIIIN